MGYNQTRALGYAKHYYHLNKEKILKYSKLYRHKNRILCMWQGARRRAKRDSLDFTIKRSELVIPEICPVLGIPLFYLPDGKTGDNTPSLDRIIPSLGYVKGNVAVISKKANIMKQNNTLETLEALMTYIKRNTNA